MDVKQRKKYKNWNERQKVKEFKCRRFENREDMKVREADRLRQKETHRE